MYLGQAEYWVLLTQPSFPQAPHCLPGIKKPAFPTAKLVAAVAAAQILQRIQTYYFPVADFQ